MKLLMIEAKSIFASALNRNYMQLRYFHCINHIDVSSLHMLRLLFHEHDNVFLAIYLYL